MKFFKLILSEKRGENYYEGIHEKFIKAQNWDTAYNKSLKIAGTFFNHSPDASSSVVDKDFVFHFNGDYVAIWINSLEELEVV